MTTLIGRYRLEEVVGEGASAQVWRGSDDLLHRAVAIKILKPALAADDALVARFFNEARAMAGLSDPAIVQIYDMIAEGDRHALVMEYVDGPSLAEILARDGALDEVRAVEIAREVTRALGVAHAGGILHRDIKPANILTTATGAAKLTDLGLAKALFDEDGGATLTGGLVGSAHYMSPEQAQGLLLTPESDLYSLGVVMHQMLTGRVPFSRDSAVATAVAHVREPAPSEAELSHSMSPGLAAIIHRLLAKSPAARYSSAAALAAALDDVSVAARIDAGPAWDAATILSGTRSVPGRFGFATKLPFLAAVALALGIITLAAAGHRTAPASSVPALVSVPPVTAKPSSPANGMLDPQAFNARFASATSEAPPATSIAPPVRWRPGHAHRHHGHHGD